MILKEGNPSYPIRHEGILASGLLTLALLDLPYGYYQLLRWFIMFLGFSIAFNQIAQRKKWLVYFGLGVAVLFNPFFKISFDREVWWLIDLALAIAFLIIGLTVRDERENLSDEEIVEGSLNDFIKDGKASDKSA